MNKAQAFKILRPLLGKNLAYRERPDAQLADEREAQRERARDLGQTVDMLRDQRDARAKLLLEQDAEYQRLKGLHAAASKQKQTAFSLSHQYRVTVGRTTSIGAFFVEAEGDNWQEVVDKVRAKRKEPKP